MRNHMAHHLSNQFVESKVSKRVIDQQIHTKNFVCKAEKDMLNQPDDVLIVELELNLASSWLGIYKFGSGVIGLNPEVITIQVGEDVATKVMSYSGNGSTVYVLSAHGVVSNVTLRQGASIHETTIYEGHFEILSLSGSYQSSETDGMITTRTGGLIVSLAGQGCVFGGGVAGALIAASPVQVVIGRFPVEEKKKLKRGATSGIPGASGSSGSSHN